MQYNELGNTGIKVSRLCFGSLTIGPLQKGLSLREGLIVMEKAMESGVNFIDTADLYGTYPYIRKILSNFPELVVATKSYAYDTQTAEDTLERALTGIGRDYIDIFLLHEQEGPLTLKGHWEALEYFIRCKEKGIIRAVGISTHHIAGVKAGALTPEIDVIHPILNYKGIGIVDGNLEEMEQAIDLAWHKGKGIYAMKPLGGGHLIANSQEAFRYILNFPHLHSIAVGMQRIEEVEVNLQIFTGNTPDRETLEAVQGCPRQLFIHDWCCGCGQCVKRCQQQAIKISQNKKAEVDVKKCILCGYCGSICKELAIKIL